VHAVVSLSWRRGVRDAEQLALLARLSAARLRRA
jgi:hypothetical protein